MTDQEAQIEELDVLESIYGRRNHFNLTFPIGDFIVSVGMRPQYPSKEPPEFHLVRIDFSYF